jgi:hypothetical protein
MVSDRDWLIALNYAVNGGGEEAQREANAALTRLNADIDVTPDDTEKDDNE